MQIMLISVRYAPPAGAIGAGLAVNYDPYYPFGRNDQQEVAAYLCHSCHMTYPDEIEAAFGFVTTNAARALRLPDYGLEPGCRADFNILAAATIRHVLRLQQPPRWVIRGGKGLVANDLKRELFLRGDAA